MDIVRIRGQKQIMLRGYKGSGRGESTSLKIQFVVGPKKGT